MLIFKKFMLDPKQNLDPDMDPRPTEKYDLDPDTDPKKIIPDPQYCKKVQEHC